MPGKLLEFQVLSGSVEMNATVDELRVILKRFRRWLKLRDAGMLAQRTLWIGVLLAVVIQLVGWLFPIELLWLWSLLPLLIWLVVAITWAVFAPMSVLRTAKRVDLELGLKERLSTAVALEEQTSLAQEPTVVELKHLQQSDALSMIQGVEPYQSLRWHWAKRSLLTAGVLFVMAVLEAALPNPMNQILEERTAVQAELQEQSEAIEELARDLAAEEALIPEERDELIRQLEELARQLQENPGDREKALADFARLEENLRQRLDPNLDERQAALAALATQLETLAREQNGEQSESSNLDEALEQLAEQLSEMNPEQQQALAQSLADMAAQAAQSGEQALAQALSALAQAALNGSSQNAQQAAQQASQALQQANQDLNAQQALAQALSQIQQGRQQVAQAGQGQQSVQNQGSGQSGDSGQNPGQSGNQGQTAGQGQPGGGGGTRANTLPPGQSQGQAGVPRGPGQQADAGRLDDQVYVPFDRVGPNGEQIFIPGQDTGQGETEVREGQDPLPGVNQPALVPYQQVFGQYLQAANQVVDSGAIPPELRDYIKQYFTQLEP